MGGVSGGPRVFFGWGVVGLGVAGALAWVFAGGWIWGGGRVGIAVGVLFSCGGGGVQSRLRPLLVR